LLPFTLVKGSMLQPLTTHRPSKHAASPHLLILLSRYSQLPEQRRHRRHKVDSPFLLPAPCCCRTTAAGPLDAVQSIAQRCVEVAGPLTHHQMRVCYVAGNAGLVLCWM